MSQSPPIRRVRSAAPPKPSEPAASAPPASDTFPADAILMSFDSWVSNTSKKYNVPADQIRGLVHTDTDPRMED